MTSDPDLTGLLQAWSQGDRDALAVLATVVHRVARSWDGGRDKPRFREILKQVHLLEVSDRRNRR